MRKMGIYKTARHSSGICSKPPLMPLLLLLLLLLLVGASRVAGYYEFSPQCGMTSVQLDRSPPVGDAEEKFQRLMQPFRVADEENRRCSNGMVCAQKLVSVQDIDAQYSEECWMAQSIVEYTELSCYSDFCNTNVTFGEVPRLKRNYFLGQGSIPIKCYNHGQLRSMSIYQQIMSPSDYSYRYGQSAPVSHWSHGMCGAAIYASMRRSDLVHERVLTGDTDQKFAILRLCPRTGCNRQIVKDYLRNGYGKFG